MARHLDSSVEHYKAEEALIEEGRRVREMLMSKRSDTLLRLFDFLLDQSAKGLQPKETEIASTVFSDMPASSGGLGSIRVYVFRLRKKLEEYYEGKSGARLTIPRGEYCIVLTQPRDQQTEALEDTESGGIKSFLRGRKLAGMAAAMVVANIAAAGFFWGNSGRPSTSPVDSVFWRPVLADGKPQTIILGDHFLFGENAGPGLPTKIIRDFSVTSPEDFRTRVINSAGDKQHFVDLNLHFVTSNIAFALRNIWPVLNELSRSVPEKTDVILASQLNPDILKSSNLIYIGPLDGLGKLLHNPLFEASGFKIGNAHNELVDKASGKQFISDSAIPADNQIPRREYGYIASFPGPANNHILVISGNGDQGMVQMADLVSDKIRLNQLRNKLGNKTQAFEALYQVRTMYSQNYGSTLLIARPIEYRGVWDRAASHQALE
jgi:hypothetical protein